MTRTSPPTALEAEAAVRRHVALEVAAAAVGAAAAVAVAAVAVAHRVALAVGVGAINTQPVGAVIVAARRGGAGKTRCPRAVGLPSTMQVHRWMRWNPNPSHPACSCSCATRASNRPMRARHALGA